MVEFKLKANKINAQMMDFCDWLVTNKIIKKWTIKENTLIVEV